MAESLTCKENFPIVGIGASAGGLAAFEAFFSGMPIADDPGMSFVLVQHLSPDYKSALSQIVGHFTQMAVHEAVDGMPVENNSVYIIPPNADMVLRGDLLHLTPPSQPHGQRLAIDLFFTSLAEERGEHAIGVVLSGNGNDGTRGAEAIRRVGGSIFVQTLESAAYESMPASVIEAGLADHILEPQAMALELIALTQRHRTEKLPTTLERILMLLHAQSRHNFTQYKHSSIARRIERRMTLHHLESLEAYLIYLQQHPEELQALFYDLLIGVTRFFRDSELFETFATRVVPKLFENRQSGSMIRIWSAGCSSGEEAYSIAILLQQHIEKLGMPFGVQIFATDIDDRAIAKARAGVYDEKIREDVPAQLLERYFHFDAHERHYRIHKHIRDMVIFSVQNVIQDPPFSKINLIVCRNLLIYFKETLQKRLIELFHYALNPGGILFLGSSEGIGIHDTLFETIDKSAKIYRKKTPSRTSNLSIALPLTLHTPLAPLTMSKSDAQRLRSLNLENPYQVHLESTNQELTSYIEEIQSMNEELQSTNEELETSKEELQSVNEELSTVNAELQSKLAELSAANDDMNNLLAGTGIGTVFVDLRFNVMRYTPAATQIINLIPSDIGRPLSHLTTTFKEYRRLLEDTAQVLETLVPFSMEVQCFNDHWYTLRIQPYRTLENVIKGAVITFVDITELVHTRKALAALHVEHEKDGQ